MKLLLMNYHYLRYPLERFLDKMQKLEVGEMELYCSGPQLNIFDYPLSKLIALDRELRRRKLRVEILTPENFSYPVNFAAADKQVTEDSLRYYQRAVDTASFLGCSKVQISVGSGYFDEDKEEIWKRCRENLETLTAYCEKKHVELLLEELKDSSAAILNNSTEVARMINEIASPALSGMLDIDQMTCAGEKPADYFANLGEKMRHIHFNDRGHTIPGDADYPMKEYYQEIVRTGYVGTCSFEICDRRYFKDPDEATERLKLWLMENTNEWTGGKNNEATQNPRGRRFGL